MRKILFLFLLTIIFIIFYIVCSSTVKNFNYPTGKIYAITLTKKGFAPSSLHIKQYDTVLFKTDLKSDFWPASDLHPTHSIYSDFDPLEPVLFSETWSFTFDKVGKWHFHDHLNPWARGTIYVEKSQI